MIEVGIRLVSVLRLTLRMPWKLRWLLSGASSLTSPSTLLLRSASLTAIAELNSMMAWCQYGWVVELVSARWRLLQQAVRNHSLVALLAAS